MANDIGWCCCDDSCVTICFLIVPPVPVKVEVYKHHGFIQNADLEEYLMASFKFYTLTFRVDCGQSLKHTGTKTKGVWKGRRRRKQSVITANGIEATVSDRTSRTREDRWRKG